MIIALISDIHGNLPALEAALEYIHTIKPDKIYCLGDIVGYGPWPNECVQLVDDTCDQSLMGNHDYAAIGLLDTIGFNPVASEAMDWTRYKLGTDSLTFLKKLPFTIDDDAFMLAHASPKNPSYWNYVLSLMEAREQIRSFEQQVCFIGHSHIPIIFSSETMYSENNLVLEPDGKYIVNVGSVGQPRDHNPNGSLVLFDTDSGSVENIRFAYDIKKTQDEIRRVGLPDFLAVRLTKGI